MNSTRISRRVSAPRAIVYRALLDARAVAMWMVPTADNEAGWRSSLAKLAALVEAATDAERSPAQSGPG